MTLIHDTILALFAIVYGIGGLFLLRYTDKLSKQIKEQQDLEKDRIQAHLDEYHAEDAEHPAPLLGVIYPPTHGYGRRHGKR